MARADSLKHPLPPTGKKASLVHDAGDRLEGLPSVIDHHIFVRNVSLRGLVGEPGCKCGVIIKHRHLEAYALDFLHASNS